MSNLSNQELTATVRELRELKAMAAEIADEIETLEDTIKAEMTERNTEELIVDVFRVRWSAVVSSRFDAIAFRNTHADLYKQYSKLVETKRFTIN